MAEKRRCGAWDGNQCKGTANLVLCVLRIEQGKFLKGPSSVVVLLCPKHFQLDLPRKALAGDKRGAGEGE